MQRLRVSSWINPTDLMVLTVSGDEKSPVKMTKDGKGRDTPILNDTLCQQGNGILDDMTIQRTMNNDEQMNPVWDPLVLPGFDPKTEQGKKIRVAFFQNVIEACHRNNMQCLVSYTMMNPLAPASRFKTFNDWLKGRAFPDLYPDDYAAKVVKFLNDNVPDCDGISFDIEGLSSGIPIPQEATEEVKAQQRKRKEAVLNDMIDMYGSFIGGLAEELAKSKKIVGVATAGMTSKTEANPGFTAEDGFRIHSFLIAQGHTNIVIRPMAYDNVKRDEKRPFEEQIEPAVQKTLELHPKIIDYALSCMTPDQFQMGFKTIVAKKQDPVTKEWKPPDYLGFITNVKTIKKQCQDLLRPKNVGIIFFPTSASFWKECNDGLNSGAPAAGAALSDPQVLKEQNPVQQPIDADVIGRMTSWRRTAPIQPIPQTVP